MQSDEVDGEKKLRKITSIFSETDTLITLNDVANSQAVNRVSELIRLAFSKHYGLLVIILAQQLTSIAKPFRKNAVQFICFYEPDEMDMKKLLSEGLAGFPTKKNIRSFRN